MTGRIIKRHTRAWLYRWRPRSILLRHMLESASLCRGGQRDGKPYEEFASLTDSLATRCDRAAMELDELADDP